MKSYSKTIFRSFSLFLSLFLLYPLSHTNIQVLIDGPAISRQVITLKKVSLTDLVLAKLPRGSRTNTVAKKWAAADIDGQWAASEPAKKLAVRARRAALSDFERFQVRILKKQRRAAVAAIAAKA